MEKEQFVNLMSQVEADMFHLAFSVLHREQECADAVQEAVVKANAGCTGGFPGLKGRKPRDLCVDLYTGYVH